MKKFLAWVGFILAIIGGAGLVGVGLAAAVQVVAVFGALILIGMDVGEDRRPDQRAVIGAFVLPSLIVGIGGDIPNWIDDKLGDLWGWATDHLGDWVGTSTIGLALGAVAISFLMSTRTTSTQRSDW